MMNSIRTLDSFQSSLQTLWLVKIPKSLALDELLQILVVTNIYFKKNPYIL